VITYGDIAKKIALQTGKTKMSAQAVGGAVGSNPISVLIPCHRVVGAKGNLTGYGGGLDIKVHLLQLEGMDMSKFHMPSK
jgi:methylated-DNA-[protein]-cysteine S-methyltransferase